MGLIVPNKSRTEVCGYIYNLINSFRIGLKIMKKLLLGTSALVAAGLVAGSAFAAEPNVSVGGFSNFQAGLVDQDSVFETGPNSRDFKTRSHNEVHVNVNGKADNGLGYGAVIELQADVTASEDASGFNADKSYIFLESGLGRAELGSNTDASRALQVNSATFARATGGVDGDWYYFVNTGGLAGTSAFIIRPDLPTAHAKGAAEDANKFTYYSPRYSGFQLGVSYTPDQGDAGNSVGFTGEANGNYENVWNLGLNYTGQFDQVGIAASATGEWGESESAAVEDLNAYALGVNLTYGGFTVGGSYGDWQDSTFAVGATNSDADYWDAGIAYETGPYGVSLTYLDSSLASNDFQNFSVGADYKLAPGLVPYIEANFFDLDDNAATTNDGSAILFGTQLNF